ncbi:hypothetical protein HELRODRAFT_72901 [Helobdella robusta]|uniref:Uncharacterized protein n=1 Tax=Helobdella robusta TaxID=6412 RepID=T1G170_HELRO|nr:hypothetical protein HELRODRAFT_72901 [Helobdella robusta]ESO09911.1 hypothetical protein HELRODRAFT_72901 [Helobdella robusta]
MQVYDLNSVKVYNLSCGKSLPDWLNERKRRMLLKKDADLRRRIQLIQDFEMPTVSTSISLSKDEKYILATGLYKPRIRCFDVNQMSLKFERCLDSEVLKFQLLDNDYSKIVFLQIDRYVEFHSKHGKYYRTRIPFFGRDFSILNTTSDLYFVGASSEVCRLNLQVGRFLSPLSTKADELNCCAFNEHHELFSCGTTQGIVECWDPRARNCVCRLDCAAQLIAHDSGIKELPSITALSYNGPTIMGVGTSTGQIQIYEMRVNKPIVTKDHNFNLPVKCIKFHRNDKNDNLVLSIDKRILKMWNQDTGKPFTSIEPESSLNDLCVVPNSGLMFMANEAPKILTYYLPDLGQPPAWCSMLTSITEELEESSQTQVYDDYKFLTRTEIDELGLSHLIGSNMLRAEMHGYYVRAEIYQKARSLVEPLKYSEYKKNRVEDVNKVESRIKEEKPLPKVNRMIAQKLESSSNTKANKLKKNLLLEGRFSKMFEDNNFEVDVSSEHYQRLVPVLPKVDPQSNNQRQPDEVRLNL